jgi:signal transduction histidine kinase
VSEDTRVPVRTRLDQALAFVRASEPRVPLSRRAIATDITIAAVALAASLALVRNGDHGSLAVTPAGVVARPAQSLAQLWKHSAAAILLTSVPLAFRRRFPLAAFAVLLAGALATRQYATDITFLAIVFAGYSAVAYSRFRNAAMLSMPLAGVLVVYAFWTAVPAGDYSVTPVSARSLGLPVPGVPHPGSLPGYDAGTPRFTLQAAEPWRLTGLVVAAALVLIAVVRNAVQARDRLRRLRAEHEAATRRALEQERARIAGELHDVVTHNVSVMIVQAGAARQVLTDSPDAAKAALLAVESSGRAAMTELRHLLGLLSPAQAPAEQAHPDTEDLRPQPGLGQLQPLIDRVCAAGLPVELHVAGEPRGLPPGQDLAAFRVVQEALTNVIKHAGKPQTTVTLDYRADDLVVEVADAGRPVPAAGPPAASGAGRGLLGLRERMTLYGGELVAQPQQGGGWLVRARMPVDPLMPAGHS